VLAPVTPAACASARAGCAHLQGSFARNVDDDEHLAFVLGQGHVLLILQRAEVIDAAGRGDRRP
jgi:hypothetical protein